MCFFDIHVYSIYRLSNLKISQIYTTNHCYLFNGLRVEELWLWWIHQMAKPLEFPAKQHNQISVKQFPPRHLFKSQGKSSTAPGSVSTWCTACSLDEMTQPKPAVHSITIYHNTNFNIYIYIYIYIVQSV